MKPFVLLPAFLLASVPVYANTAASEAAAGDAAQTQAPAHDTWADRTHERISNRIDRTADRIDNWFGTPDPNNPASATLRIMLDTHWNEDDGATFKPRVRGRIKLPVLEERLSVVFGDDTVDEEYNSHIDTGRINRNRAERKFEYRNTRDQNASLALRFSRFNEQIGLDTDADIGIRSGSDLYLRLKAAKKWQHTDSVSSRIEQIYRYGIKSEHHARTSYELRYAPAEKPFISNELYAEYNHDDDKESWGWGNNLYRQHNFQGNKRLNYGIFTGGSLNKKPHKLNTYGPFVGWRQPIWRDWLFVQTELNYYNNRDENRNHRVGGFLRLEAIF